MNETLGNPEFKDLYFEYHPMLFRVAMYVLKDNALAEDVVQECFIKVWKNWEKFDEVKNKKSYLISMTRNAAFDELKSFNNENDAVLQLVGMPDGEDETIDANFKKVLEEAVSNLPPKCRLIFSLSRFEGLSNEEIAEYLNISKRTVETQISIALKAFRGELRPIFEEYFSSLAVGLVFFSMLQI